MAAASHGPGRTLFASSVFALTLVAVYLCSTLYHALVLTRARHVFQVLDHAAIYLLIAGTYTPFLLGPLRGPLGNGILAAEWGMAAAGIAFKAAIPTAFTSAKLGWASALLYLGQGWLVVVALSPLRAAIGADGLLWLGAGGVAYTLGILFFAFDSRRYFHAAWHLFVLAGSACHWYAVLRFAR